MISRETRARREAIYISMLRNRANVTSDKPNWSKRKKNNFIYIHLGRKYNCGKSNGRTFYYFSRGKIQSKAVYMRGAWKPCCDKHSE